MEIMVELQEDGSTWVVLETRAPGVMGVCGFVCGSVGNSVVCAVPRVIAGKY